MKNYGALGSGSFQEAGLATAMSTVNTIVMLNIASGLRLLPAGLYNLVYGAIKRWLFNETHITIPETGRSTTAASGIFTAAEAYLGTFAQGTARQLRASTAANSRTVTVSIDDSGVVSTDTFHVDNVAIAINWSLHWIPAPSERERPTRSYKLAFNSRHRRQVVERYLDHVMAEGARITSQQRQLKLCTNHELGGSQYWSRVAFDHPATFDALAMDPVKKREVMDDLEAFSSNREYYARIGKAWKRGYLLYGPPGTGKSTMIACIANFLKYDVYDLELTAVPSNTCLRSLMVDIPGKSIIVIEDIDCSFDLSCSRVVDDPVKPSTMGKTARTALTLSGMLNFVDGLWSACGAERLVVFTTNHRDRLDPALIRKGRMDVQIELSYCRFEAFKVLARNYLGVDEHPLFERVKGLLEEVEITPADVAERLLPKSLGAGDRVEECLGELIGAMEKMRDGKGSRQDVKKKHE